MNLKIEKIFIGIKNKIVKLIKYLYKLANILYNQAKYIRPMGESVD